VSGIRRYGAFRPTEKDEESAGDRLMAALGFDRWALSQPRHTMQTPGWPDRFYTHEQRQLAVFWEAKRPGGKQRPPQRQFQAAVTACGIPYLCGPCDVLTDWCQAKGLVRVLPNGGLEIVRQSARPRCEIEIRPL
jgi:hypothetical protein